MFNSFGETGTVQVCYVSQGLTTMRFILLVYHATSILNYLKLLKISINCNVNIQGKMWWNFVSLRIKMAVKTYSELTRKKLKYQVIFFLFWGMNELYIRQKTYIQSNLYIRTSVIRGHCFWVLAITSHNQTSPVSRHKIPRGPLAGGSTVKICGGYNPKQKRLTCLDLLSCFD